MAGKFTGPREIEIQYTREEAINQVGDDEDSSDEDSLSNVDFEIGQSRETIEISSWSEIPNGYEPVDKNDRTKFEEWKEDRFFS
ncbi:MAG: hypothetical protein J6I53_06135 [Treponema sp.]|nr:hypothetical protein [Treponema sp.]